MFSPLLKSFQKTLMALEDLSARNTTVAVQKREQAMDLEEEATDLMTEARKAEDIAKNLRELLGA